MALLTTTKISHDVGAIPTYVAAGAGGDTFSNDGRTLLHVKNGGGAPITVTIDSVVLSNQGVDTNPAISVPAGAERMIGPFNPNRFNTSGLTSVSYSGVTSVTVGVVRMEDPG